MPLHAISAHSDSVGLKVVSVGEHATSSWGAFLGIRIEAAFLGIRIEAAFLQAATVRKLRNTTYSLPPGSNPPRPHTILNFVHDNQIRAHMVGVDLSHPRERPKP
jgi:hypothetical protein